VAHLESRQSHEDVDFVESENRSEDEVLAKAREQANAKVVEGYD
jgi:hypothetical protein